MTLPPLFWKGVSLSRKPTFQICGKLAFLIYPLYAPGVKAIWRKMIDSFGREINYLRISVTDRCNLRCVYCMPAHGIIHKQPSDILSFEQIYSIVKAAVGLGIRKVRITGGEPLVRKDLPALIAELKTINGLKEICLTTNGIYLSEYALAIKEAGLDRINISLDSLNKEKFRKITQGGNLEMVLSGIDRALAAGLAPLKINNVLLKDFNTDEIADFANLTKARPLHVRFIEYMPTGLHGFCADVLGLGHGSYDDIFLSAQEAKNICRSVGELEPVEQGTADTAEVFKIRGFLGSVGFISPISRPFCASCNKLRLTSEGRLRNCLHSSKTIDLKKAFANNNSQDELAALIQEAISLKPEFHNLPGHHKDEKNNPLVPIGLEAENFSMCQIGG